MSDSASAPTRGLTLRTSLDRLWASEAVRDIAVVGGAALMLGLFRLGRPSLWVDEAFTARALDRSLPDLLDRQYHVLYYSILKPWALVAGRSEWALRFPSVLGTIVACALLVVLGRKLFDRWTALASGVLLAASPLLVKWSQQARSYTMLLAICVLATLLLLRAVERGSRGAWLLYGLVFSVLVIWHPVAGVLLAPAHAVYIIQRRERAMPHTLLAALIVLVVGVPWAGVTAIRSTGEGVAMNWLEFPTFEVGVRALLDVSGAAGIGLVAAVLGLWLLRRAGSSVVAVWLGTWALAPFVVALLISLVRPIYLDRYLIVAAPAFALLGGVAVTGVATRARVMLVTILVLASSAGLAHWYSSGDGGNWRGEDWRSAARTVLDRRYESDAILVAPWSAAPAAQYYGADVIDISAADSIWVLTWSETGDDISLADRRALGFGDHRLVEKLEFGRRVKAELWRRAG